MSYQKWFTANRLSLNIDKTVIGVMLITVHHRPPPSSTVHHRPPPSSTVHHRVVMVKYCYVIAIDVILYIVTNPACHQRNKRDYVDRLVGWYSVIRQQCSTLSSIKIMSFIKAQKKTHASLTNTLKLSINNCIYYYTVS